LKEHLFKKLYETYGKDKKVFQIVGEIYKDLNFQYVEICSLIDQDMTYNVSDTEAVQQHIESIKFLLTQKFGSQISFKISKNPNKGANESFLVNFENQRFYIKTFSRTLIPDPLHT